MTFYRNDLLFAFAANETKNDTYKLNKIHCNVVPLRILAENIYYAHENGIQQNNNNTRSQFT